MNFSEMTQASARGVKQAALLMHAMAPADQEWLWSQLPSEQKEELKALIAELDELGVAKDRQALSLELAKPEAPFKAHDGAQKVPQGNEAIENASALSDVEFLCALTRDEVHDLATIWSGEPPLFVALALNAYDWPWRALLLKRMPTVHKRKIEDLLLQQMHGGAPLRIQAVLQGTRACLVQMRREAMAVDSLLDGNPHDSDRQVARIESDRGRAGLQWQVRIAESIRAPWRRFLPSRLKGRP